MLYFRESGLGDDSLGKGKGLGAILRGSQAWVPYFRESGLGDDGLGKGRGLGAILRGSQVWVTTVEGREGAWVPYLGGVRSGCHTLGNPIWATTV